MPWWSLKVAMTTFPRSLYLYNISRGQLSSDTPHCRLCSGIPISWRCNVVTRTSPPFPILTPRHLPFLVCYLTQTSDLRAQRVELVVGDLSRSEAWWRDRYYSIKNCGYRLRPRYHPKWEPSWIRSGKASCETEDGQNCQVRVVH